MLSYQHRGVIPPGHAASACNTARRFHFTPAPMGRKFCTLGLCVKHISAAPHATTRGYLSYLMSTCLLWLADSRIASEMTAAR